MAKPVHSSVQKALDSLSRKVTETSEDTSHDKEVAPQYAPGHWMTTAARNAAEGHPNHRS
ncbi:MAG: hypothetical protein JWO54_455 [Candidatus Saccharibacteria bacterium]|jgi:hypothetical protein|nr:hypothetical protein [Candidatus Saccharibacteria bacterium]MDB5180695.1 hypothetical protein [Candidatus Saccharibacteria bacterium]